jgi:CDP-4-dehydro-6-deoxyglucose reductase/ferredoxin-NAD(P)+ reductase (naphthalene dioxygenase ferredoxin-specific)
MTPADTTARRTYQGRILSVEDIGADMRILKIEPDLRQKIPFQPGQYALLSFDGLAPRAFSIASAPQDSFLEFHIRNTGRGETSEKLLALAAGHTVTIDMPHGTNFWRPSARPILAIAGGMGIAPLRAILDAHLTADKQVPARLYWGTRSAAHLYLDAQFREWSRRSPQFSYIPVLSDEDHERLRRGFPADAVAEDFQTLGDVTIYMAGPPQMIDVTLPKLLQIGADPAHIFCDGWDTTSGASP